MVVAKIKAVKEVLMSRRLVIFAILFGSLLIGLPVGTSANTLRDRSFGGGGDPQIIISSQPRRRYRRSGYWSGRRWYKNYGQYRRTQVGWRRYRVTPRYYWRDGRRYQTYRRVYYYNY